MFPRLIEIPFVHVTIHSYGVMVALGMLAGIWVSVQRAHRAGVAPDVFYDMGLWSMVAGILGARLAYVQAHWEEFQGRPLDILKIWQGGQVLYGGLILAVLVNLWMLKRRNLPVLRIADLAAPAVPLGIGIGRLGCFLNGCCFGKEAPAGFPLAVRFPEGSPAAQAHGAIHPAQLYASISGILVYVILSFWHERRRWDGQILAGTMILYALGRIFEEHFRADTPVLKRFWGTLELNAGQLLSVYVLAAGVLCYLLWGVRGRRNLQDL